MKQTFVRLTLLLVLLGMFVCAFAACGEKKKPVADDVTSENPADSGTDSTVTTEDPNKIPELPTVDYGGQEFLMLIREDGGGLASTREDMYFDSNPAANNGSIVDQRVWARNQRIMEETGIQISANRSSSNNSDTDQLNPILNNDDTYDLIANHGRSMTIYATKGALANWYDVPFLSDCLDYDWWEQGMREDFTVNGKLWILSGDLSWTGLGATICMVMNKALARKLQIDYQDLYYKMDDGEWTFEEFKTQVAKANAEMGTDDSSLSVADGDYMGYMTGYYRGPLTVVFSGGDTLVRNNGSEIELTLNTPRTEQIFSDYFALLQEPNVYYPGTGTGTAFYKSFANGNVLFTDTRLYDVSWIQEEMSDYAVFPWPKYDENVAEYYAWRDAVANIFGIPVTIKGDRLERVGVILEMLSRYGNETVIPAFYQRVLLSRYGQDEYGQKAIDYIKAGRRYDLGTYMSSLSKLQNVGPEAYATADHSYTTWYNENSGKVDAQIAETNLLFGDMGF